MWLRVIIDYAFIPFFSLLLIILILILFLFLLIYWVGWLTDTHLYTFHRHHYTMPFDAMLQRSVYITVRQADLFFVWVLRGEQIRVPGHTTGSALHLSLHGILLLIFSISCVMCVLWRVVYSCVRVSWNMYCGAVWCGGWDASRCFSAVVALLFGGQWTPLIGLTAALQHPWQYPYLLTHAHPSFLPPYLHSCLFRSQSGIPHLSTSPSHGRWNIPRSVYRREPIPWSLEYPSIKHPTSNTWNSSR